MSAPGARYRICLCLLLLLSRSSTADEPLEWKWVAGDRLRVEVRQRMEQQWNSGERQTEMATEVTADWLLTVPEVSHDGQASVVQRLERVQVVSDFPALGRVQFDSQSPQPPQGLNRQLAQHYKPLVGQEIQQRIDVRGEISDVQVPEVLATANPLLPAAGGGLSAAVLVFPADPLQPGHTWETTHSVRIAQASARLHAVYKYVGPVVREDRQVEEFDVSSTLTLDSVLAATAPPLTIQQQSSQGKLWFDRQAGRLTAGQVRQELTLQTGQGDSPAVQTTINTTDVKIFPAPPEEAAEPEPAPAEVATGAEAPAP
jgi:hypothetical protein